MKKLIMIVLASAALLVATFAIAQNAHPNRHVAQKGDTLWDISARFLGKPWLWPEIWQASPQVHNPHLIYPGDVPSLSYANRIGLDPGPRIGDPISAIPLHELSSFLEDYHLVSSLSGLPRVVGLEEGRLLVSPGHLVYGGFDGGARGSRWAIMRPETILSASVASCRSPTPSTFLATT